MNNVNDSTNKVIYIFLILIALALFGILLYLSSSILNPILVYVLVLFVYLINRHDYLIKQLFLLASIIFLIWFLNELSQVILPFLISFLIAYLLNPFVAFLEEKKIPRWAGSLLSILIILGSGSIFLFLIIPPFINQVSVLISSAPQLIESTNNFLSDKVLPQLQKLGIAYPDLQKFIVDELPNRLQNLVNGLLNSFLTAISKVGLIFNQLINLIIIPIISFYLLKDYKIIFPSILKLFKEENQIKIQKLTDRVDSIFGNYIRGFVIIALINGVVITTGLSLVGVQYAVVLGIISAVLCFIPYFGVIISFSIGFIISIISGISGLKILFIPILYFGENLLESSVFIPKIIGKRMGIHPLLILLAIFTFGYFGGVTGMIIAVPTTALLISFIKKED